MWFECGRNAYGFCFPQDLQAYMEELVTVHDNDHAGMNQPLDVLEFGSEAGEVQAVRERSEVDDLP